MDDQAKVVKLSVRLDENDEAALQALRAHVKVLVGPGVRVDASDTIRWALHAAVEALVVNASIGEDETLPGHHEG